MQLCLQKTLALLWCATLFLWLPLSSNEPSDTSNGHESSFDSGLGSVEDVQPSESSSGSNLVKNSNGFSKQVIESPSRRHLEQSSASSGDEDGVSCNLTQSQQSRFHSTYSDAWNISDAVLKELQSDIQSIADCAAPHDTILISTNTTIQPLRSIVISKNLTISSQHEGPLLMNGSIRETKEKVKFSCPSSGDLFVIRSGVILANLIFEECKGTGHVMSIETRCDEDSTQATVHLRHLEFRELSLSEDRRILESVQPSCTQLSMEHVVLRDNTCGTSGCMSLSMNNTLRDIQVTGNQAMPSNVALESQTVFMLPVKSTSVATNVSALRNGARVFSVANATLTLKSSRFDRNTVDQDVGTSLGGSVLFSNDSTIRIRDSMFERNSGLNGGAIYALASNLNLFNCTFRENYADIGNGGVVYANNRSSLSIVGCTFSKNNAVLGAGVFSSESLHVLVMNTVFEENDGTKGAALYLTSENATIESCDVLQCNGTRLGNGWMTVIETGFITESSFCSNNTDWRGVCAFQVYSSVRMNGVQFIRNQASENGGALYAQHVAMDISNASFQGNTVDEAGSAIHLSDGFMRLEDVSIADNSADLYGTALIGDSSAMLIRVLFFENSARSYGGGLSFHNSNITIRNSTFENNSAGYSGGAIYASSNSRLDVLSTTFQNNSAQSNGGGIYAWNGEASVKGSNFASNTGDNGGGGYFNDVDATLEGVHASHNRAIEGSGGGFYLNTGKFNVRASMFQTNQASGQGGGISCSNMVNVSLSGIHFAKNSARQSGGGIYSENLENMSLLDVRFENNTARQSGGGMYGEDLVAMSSSDVLFENNVGRSGGGGYYINVNATMHDLTVSRNRATDGSGGGLYLDTGTLDSDLLTFKANQASGQGGAIHIYNTTMHMSPPCVFLENNSTANGGSIYHRSSQSTISSCRFENNTALSNGSMWIGDNSTSTISNCTFIDGMASFYGGGLRICDNTQVSITNSSFSRCKTNDGGGAISLSTLSSLTVSMCKFLGNRAYSGAGIDVYHGTLSVSDCEFKQGRSRTFGGGIYAKNGKLNAVRSTFERNKVSDGAGGGIALHSSNAIIKDTELFLNKAKNFGGIQVASSSGLTATNLSLHSNVATENGGGLGVKDGSSLLCSRCDFRDNIARWSGGLYVQADDSILVVAQLQDSIFLKNTASSFGGGLHFNRSQNRGTNCTAPRMMCGHIALLNTMFANNTAAFSGSAILTSDPERVLVSCNHTKPQHDFIGQDLLSSLAPIQPNNTCGSWTGNRIETANPTELNVSTFGQHLSFSTKNDSNTRVTGDVESGFVLEDVTGGRWLPLIQVTVLDAYRNGPSYTISEKFEATMESPSRFFNDTRTLTIINGSGNISEIASLKPPGEYIIKIVPSDDQIQTAKITVHVRECLVGEEFTTHNFCQPCNAVSYSFNATKDIECALCPNGASCETRYIVPKDGYWHKGPCHANVQECLIEEACTYGERQQKLKNYSRSYVNCSFNETVLNNYNEVLCKDGYKGPLCGSCNHSYGLSVQFKCLECPHAFGSVLTLIGFTLYLLAIASITIRGGLPLKLKKSKVNAPSESVPSQTPSRSSSDEQIVNLEMVAMISQDQVASTDIQEDEAPSSSSAQPHVQSNEPELTRWITTEIFKVMINFLQVTASAASINVEWTEGILTMFEATEYVGALSSDALSSPIDCLISSDSASIRSTWRTCLNIFVPIFVAMWAIVTHREKKGTSYFWKRAMLSIMVVTYIAYLGLTKLVVRVFYCVDVFDSVDYSSNSHTRYWAVDTSIKCYEREHVGLIVISLFVLLIVSVSFPLLSATYLFQNKAQPERTDRWTHETMGFLYRAFKEKYVFWESLVMFRKACLSLTVVFSYPLGGQSQGLLALGVLLLCLYLQQTCFPYREEFHKLNYYESGSLLVSCFTFILGQFFAIKQCTDVAKAFVEVLIIVLNTTFFTFLLVVLVKNGMNHIRAVLKFKNYPIDDNTSWWRLLKLFIESKKSKATLSQD